ncbi:MAG: hypothetical protein VKL42_08885 [Snowella sp.]|nr:hypothetical protein [Snowella sp.]
MLNREQIAKEYAFEVLAGRLPGYPDLTDSQITELQSFIDQKFRQLKENNEEVRQAFQ